MIVCPQCGSPQSGDFRVIGEREITCDFCQWTGSSKELVDAPDDQVKDPRSFDLLADWVRDMMGAQLVTGLYINGLLPARVQVAASANDERVIAEYLTKVIRTFVAGVMEGVMDPNVLEKDAKPVTGIKFLHWFSKNVEKDFIRGLVQLNIVKKDMNPANLRYITKLVRHGARKMWALLVEDLIEEINVEGARKD